MNQPRHTEIVVELSGCDGNALAIVGRVKKALRRAGIPEGEIQEFRDEALSGDYDHVLATCDQWVTVE